MKLLLDTCTLIWLASDPEQLSQNASKHLADTTNDLFLSDISVLEIALKYTRGKIKLPTPPRDWVENQMRYWGIRTVGLDRHVIYRTTELPLHHADPFDRLLVATCLERSMRIVTPDVHIHRYPVSWLW